MEKITSTLAKETNGNIQITFMLPRIMVEKAKKEALEHLAKDVEIPGFRKGKAPIDKVAQKIPLQELIQHALGHLLPKALAEAISGYKIRPAIYPKFELISAKDGEDWQIRAITCELPPIILGNYKDQILGALKAKTDEKGRSKEQKEEEIIKVLLESIKFDLPKMLVDEEVNMRLSSLLERIEKLGLNLESYLASVGKTPESLRGEYALQAKNTIALELILEKIAESEKVKVSEAQIDDVIKASQADSKLSEKLNTPEQRRVIASILRRRAALDSLSALI